MSEIYSILVTFVVVLQEKHKPVYNSNRITKISRFDMFIKKNYVVELPW